jgi:hypothetical protein
MKSGSCFFSFFVMSFFAPIFFTGYAQEAKLEMNQPENWEEIAGTVENFNLDTSMMVVKVYSDEGKAAYQEVPILIMKEAKILKNGKVFILKNLKTRDKISARYIVTASGQKAAYHLWVK